MVKRFLPFTMMQPVKNWIKQNFTGLVYNHKKDPAKKKALLEWLQQWENKSSINPAAASFDIFTYHGEDGIIAWLLQQLKNVKPVFVDIGAGNCITSNCSMLAVHFNWTGLFVDMNEKQLALGRKFYGDKAGQDLRFTNAEVTTGNINALIADAGINGEIGLLSIDVDGNDYWLWKALENVSPRIVVIEAKVEFGHGNWLVPYGKSNHHSVDKKYNGASVEALRKLGEEKGYKLIGANKQGYNLFFVREEEKLNAISTGEILNYPDTISSFYPESFFAEHDFVKG